MKNSPVNLSPKPAAMKATSTMAWATWGKRNADHEIAIDPTGTQPYWQYRYDSRERLIEVRKDGNTIARYGYNPMGERTKKELPETGTTIHYLYNEQGLIGEYDDSGQLIQEYGWKPQGLWSTDPLFT